MKKFKKVNLPWLDEIPQDWDVVKLKEIFDKNFSGFWGEDADENLTALNCIRIADFDFENMSLKPQINTIRYYKKSEIEQRKVLLNDILLEKSGGGEKSPVGRVVFNDKFNGYMCANFMNVLRIKDNLNPKYISYVLKLIYHKNYIQFFIKQTTGIQNLNINEYISQNIILPPKQEQIKIASFLDDKISKIDKAIKEKQDEVKRLDELKNSIINKAVTGKLNKNAKFKKIDLPWLDEIPINWDVKNIGSIFEERKEKVSDKIYPPLSVTKDGIFPQLENVAKSIDTDNRKKVLKGDFVINSRSDRKGSSGLSEYDGSVSLINIVMIPKMGNPTYWHYLLKSNDFTEEFYKNGKGIVADLWTTSFTNMKSIVLPLPPKQDQIKIAMFLDEKISILNKAKINLQTQIKNLSVLKQSLISGAVSGKML